MHKFFVENKQISKDEIIINGLDVNHIINVLRLKIGEKIIICDKDNQKSFKCYISEYNEECIICNMIDEIKDKNESNIYIHIFQGLPKFDKLEYIIEKCTELGVKEITPVIMNRSIAKIEEKNKSKKMLRWKQIAEVAAKQSKRDLILQVNEPIFFKNIFEKMVNYDIIIVAYEDEKIKNLKQIFRNSENKYKKIAVVIGPEGGITEEEIGICREKKFQIITLGKRILRTETAPIVIASNILYELED